MGKKRKHSETEVTAPKDDTAPERPKRTLMGWKDKNQVKEQADYTVFRNKEKILVTCSRRISYRYRHLMLNVVSLLPHCKKDNKVESKSSKGATLNELVELKSYFYAIMLLACLFQCRKRSDLYLWMAKCPSGPSVKFLVSAAHTMEELKLSGNNLKGSGPLLTFSANCFLICGTPKEHRKSKPYHDHVFPFSILDGHIWFRNYQLSGSSNFPWSFFSISCVIFII
ncbi:ribosome biogenesis protein BRX1-like [Tripterygium wilfordii]|uniref:Ribosome biogenesis protein BRX1-like n=1 Tax=Tripterygium wilfordii TaxID=458696 RepID=A0A7J7C977_TRIWF|nr:ribosome biogenesis protein BRX1-like [Tripterygium wilfordii]